MCQVWFMIGRCNDDFFYQVVKTYHIKGVVHLKKKIPLPKDALCKTWLKLAQSFWRRFLADFKIYPKLIQLDFYMPYGMKTNSVRLLDNYLI